VGRFIHLLIKKARRVFTLRRLDNSYHEYLMKASLNPAALTFLSMASEFALHQNKEGD